MRISIKNLIKGEITKKISRELAKSAKRIASPDFEFTVKAHKSMTHEIREKSGNREDRGRGYFVVAELFKSLMSVSYVGAENFQPLSFSVSAGFSVNEPRTGCSFLLLQGF